MNRAQRELIDEVGLGTLLALGWCLALLTLLIIKPTPTMQVVTTSAAGIGLLFAVAVGFRYLYLGKLEASEAKRKGNRIKLRR